MSMQLNYVLADSSKQVEASQSLDPDDISRVTIKIRATAAAAIAAGSLERVTFALSPALTATPDSITAVVSEFGQWGFANMGGGTFEARPNRGVSLAKDHNLTFLLHDVEVSPGEDDGAIVITEFPSGETVTKTIAKVKAGLRIDEFSATPPEIARGGSVNLVWATTEAETVTVVGPGVNHTGDEDHTLPVSPVSTAVYTLTAKNGSDVRTAQVVVTVRDHIEPIDPAGSIQASSAIFGRVGVGLANAANPGDLAVQNQVSSRSIETGDFKLTGKAIGLHNSFRFIRTQNVFTHLSTSPVSPRQISEMGFQNARVLRTGISIAQDEAVLAHWCVPLNNFGDIDKVMCFTTVIEVLPRVFEIALALTTPPGGAFAIRVAIFALVIKDITRSTEDFI